MNRISTDDVHNITSGQVITEIKSLVKELLENSIDANSTVISITFKKYGLEGIEILDNGDGISNEDFNNICLKNYTSKLEKFENLISVKTLGFRGEALNSICNISDIVITTSIATEAPKGWELTFKKSGELLNKKMVNQSKGTCVKITEIFKDLPVRKLNFEKMYRKEFQKCIDMLISYLIILTNVRILVTNIDIAGKKKVVLKTSGNKKIKDNIINVYGSSGLDGLTEIDKSLELNNDYMVKMNGMISKASFGDGRLTKDRQFIFINNRPVEYKKLLKLINETYKKMNYLQNPVIMLNFQINEKLLDINVTPDKRTILLSNKFEKLLFEKIVIFLEDFWYNGGTYSLPFNSHQVDDSQRINKYSQQILSSFALVQDNSSQNNVDTDVNIEIEDDFEIDIVERASIRNSRVIETSQILVDDIVDDESINDTAVLKDSQNIDSNIDSTDNFTDDRSSIIANHYVRNDTRDESMKNEDFLSEQNIDVDINMETKDKHSPHSCCSHSHENNNEDESLFVPEIEKESLSVPELKDEVVYDDLPILEKELIDTSSQIADNHTNSISPENPKKVRIHLNDLKFPLSKRRRTEDKTTSKNNSVEKSDFMDKELSETLLGLSISKNDFLQLKIIGQFNKGFIIVLKENTGDILIVDQHASDEKFNFERLIAETQFENQPLVMSQKLDITPIDKFTILNNLNIFEKNGFKFKTKSPDSGDYTSDDAHQEEIHLVSLPYSKNTIFNNKDLDELIQLVGEQNGAFTTFPRPSKVRSMFAMRACRSSIMIGQSLNRPKMEKIVKNLATLDKPWNCPHGRPTMRHIVRINEWKSFTNDYEI